MLREALRGDLDDAVVDRPVKIGFARADASWVAAAAPWIDGVLEPDQWACVSCLDAAGLHRRWTAIKRDLPGLVAGPNPLAGPLWRWVSQLGWAREFSVDLG